MGEVFSVRPESPRARWSRGELQPPLRHTALYKMWDAAGSLLYIGITGNPIERWRAHAQKKPWWPRVAVITWVTYPKEHLALEAERTAIRAEHPEFNIRSVASVPEAA